MDRNNIRLYDPSRHGKYTEVVTKKLLLMSLHLVLTMSADVIQFEQTKNHAKTSNKTALDPEKEKDTAEKSREELSETTPAIQEISNTLCNVFCFCFSVYRGTM